MKKVTVLGSINMDISVSADKMPQKGETVFGKDFAISAGGKGLNQAIACSKMGADVTFIGCVGSDAFGCDLVKTLKAEKINTDFVFESQNAPTGTAMIILSENDNRIIVNSGANFEVTPKMLDAAQCAFKAGYILLCQLESPLETVVYALKKAKQCGMVTVLNPAPYTALTKEIYQYTDYIVPNKTECENILGVEISAQEETALCGQLAQTFLTGAIITLGAQGSVYCEKGANACKQNAIKVKAVDTTAAGDTFCGALVSAMAHGKSMDNAVIFATAASSLAVTKRGASSSIPNKIDVINLLKKEGYEYGIY
ncbi:MAG: ribokinase [Oscillospiraceae bacterium]